MSRPTTSVDPEMVSMWRGKKLNEYSKEELIEIVIELGQSLQQESYEHVRQLDVMGELLRGKL